MAAIEPRQGLITTTAVSRRRRPAFGLALGLLFLAMLVTASFDVNAQTAPAKAPPNPEAVVKSDPASSVTMSPRGEAIVYDTAPGLIQPQGPSMWSATMAPDGKTIVTSQGDRPGKGEVRVWDRDTAKVKLSIPFEQGIRSIVYAPDGSALASGAYDGAVRFHDTKTFAVFAVGDATSGGHKNGVNVIAFFKKGKYLASSGFDNTVRVWDVEAINAAHKPGETIHVPPVAIFEGHTQRLLSVAGSDDGKTLLSGAFDKTARVWDVPDPLPKMGAAPAVVRKEAVLLNHKQGVEAIAVSPDGKHVASGDWSGLVYVRDRSGATVEFSAQISGSAFSAAFSRDGKYLAFGGGKDVRVWDVSQKKEIARRSDFGDIVRNVEFSTDGKTLVVAVTNQTVHVWPWAEPKDQQTLIPTGLAFTPQAFLAAAISPDGTHLAFSGESKSVFVYNRTDNKLVIELTGHADVVEGLAFAPDGKTLASASHDKTIKLWNTETWKERRVLSSHTGKVFSVAFAPDGGTLATGSFDKTIRLWDAQTGELKGMLQGHSGGIRSLAFSPDGKRLISGGSDRVPRIWDVADRKILVALKGHKNAVRSVAFAPDGKTVASGSEDQSVKLWDAATGKEIHTFTGLPDLVTAIRFSPKGQTIVVGTFQGQVLLLDPLSRRVRQTLRGPTDMVPAVLFADSGERILAVSHDRSIRQWSLVRTAIANPEQSFTSPIGCITTVAIAPSGSMAVFANINGGITAWDPKSDTFRDYYGGSHPGGVVHLAVSDALQIASIGKDGLLVGNLRTTEIWKGTGVYAVFTPNGKHLAVAEGKDVVLRDSATGAEVKRFAGGHDGNVVRIEFSPDGSKLISAGTDTTVRLWNVATGRKLQATPAFGNGSTITHLAFSSDGTRFAAAAFGPEQPPPDDMPPANFKPIREVRVFNVPTNPEAEFANPVTFATQPNNLPLAGLHWTGVGLNLLMTGSNGTVRLVEVNNSGAPERQRFVAHEATVFSSAVSTSGGILLTVGEDMAVRRWKLPGIEPLPGQARILADGLTRVWIAAPSPNGKYFVTAGEGDKTFRVYAGVPTSIPVEQENQAAVISMAFSPDNRFVVTGHTKGLLIVRDAATGKALRTLKGMNQAIQAVAFAEKGAALVAAGGVASAGEAMVWNFADGTIRHELIAPTQQMMIAVHPDGKSVAISASDGKVRVFDVKSGKLLTTFGKGASSIKTVAYDSTGDRIAAGGWDHAVHIWDARTGAELRSISTGNLVPTKALFSPDDKELVISAWNGGGKNLPSPPTVTAYALDKPGAPPRQFAAWTSSALGLAFLPDGKTLVAGGGDSNGGGTLRLYDFASARLLGELSRHRHWVQAFAVSPDGSRLASTSWAQWATGEFRLWDPRGFQPVAEVKVTDETHYLACGEIGLDGKLLVLGGKGQSLTAWDMSDPAKPVLRKKLTGHVGGLRSITFDSAGKRFVSTDDKGMVHVWDAATLEQIVAFKASDLEIYRARFTPDGSGIVTVSGNWQAQAPSEMRIWDPKTGQELGRFPDQPREIWDIAFLNGGRLLATLPAFSGKPDDAHIKIWDFEKKVVVRSLLPPGTFNGGRCLGVSPDGKHLAIGSTLGPVKVFETASWQEVLHVPTITNCTFRVEFTRDSNTLLVASGEGAALVLHLP